MEGFWRAGEYVLASTLEAECVEQQKQADLLRKDAERYRWLRHAMPHEVAAINNLEEHEWDVAIDAAMLKTPNAELCDANTKKMGAGTTTELIKEYGLMVRPSLCGNWRAGKWKGVTGDGKAYCAPDSEAEAPTIEQAVLDAVAKLTPNDKFNGGREGAG